MTPILIGHIIIAISGLLVASFGAIRPSSNTLAASYGLLGATLASGTVLVIITNSPLVGACVSGLVYSTAVLAMTFVAHKRLIKAKISQK